MARAWRPRLLRLLLGLALPAVLLFVAWRGVDPAAGLRRLADAGPLAALALLPAGLMLALDSAGWWLLLSPQARRSLRFRQVFAARLAGEAAGQSLPSAGLAGEAASAWYLSHRTRLPLGEAVGSLAARRVLLAPGHAALLLLAAIFGALDPRVPRGLVALVAGAALLLLVAALAGSRLLVHGAPFARVRILLRRAPWAGLRSWAHAGEPGARGLKLADREAARPFVSSPGLRAAAAAAFALVFLTEAAESLLLLWLVGAQVAFAQVVAIEPLVSLLRALAFFAPAGLGVQDLGYVALLHQVNVPQAAAVAAAFVVLKRGKEAFWTVLGWGVLLTADLDARSAAMEDASEPEAENPVRLRVAQPDHPAAPGRARVA